MTTNIYGASVMDAQKARLLELEQRKRVVEEITKKVEYLLTKSSNDGLVWCGSKGELLELLHEVYLRGNILMPNGCPVTMTYLVKHCFDVFGLTVMKNISSHAQRAKARKGIRGGNLIGRIHKLMFGYRGEEKVKTLWETLIVDERCC